MKFDLEWYRLEEITSVTDDPDNSIPQILGLDPERWQGIASRKVRTIDLLRMLDPLSGELHKQIFRNCKDDSPMLTLSAAQFLRPNQWASGQILNMGLCFINQFSGEKDGILCFREEQLLRPKKAKMKFNGDLMAFGTGRGRESLLDHLKKSRCLLVPLHINGNHFITALYVHELRDLVIYDTNWGTEEQSSDPHPSKGRQIGKGPLQ